MAVHKAENAPGTGKVADMSKAKSPRERTAVRSPAVFPAPDHDHDRCSSDAMAVAEAVCAERGQRLTPIRRKVLAALLGSHKPLGAYEIIDRLAPRGPRPAPITAYRALEFLRENGLVHRIESRNAFIACVHNHAVGALVVFLICERCGAVGEASSAEVTATLTSAARAVGFTPKSPVIELTGICTHCGAA
jgi:Fur family zinc uptake transcriptional regulator